MFMIHEFSYYLLALFSLILYVYIYVYSRHENAVRVGHGNGLSGTSLTIEETHISQASHEQMPHIENEEPLNLASIN